MSRFDLVIVGGGPAGLAAAIHAARRGLSAVVLERRVPPLDKACGEGLMPGGVDALRALGVGIAPAECRGFGGIRYIGAGRTAEARFRRGAGLGVRRTVLAERLAARAVRVGADLRWGCPAEAWRRVPGGVEVRTPAGTVRGRLLVGADGLHSRVREQAGLAAPRGAEGAGRRAERLRFGVRRHFRVPPWTDLVEVHWSGAAEAYVTPVGPRLVGVALLWEGGSGFDDLLRRFPRLEARLAGAEPASEALGAGPLRQRVGRRTADRVALVGDAAGAVDALTGEGLGLGFEAARALADIVAAGRPLESYEGAYRRLARRYYWGTEALLAVASRPALRRRLVPALARRPGLFRALLELAVGGRGGRRPAPAPFPATGRS